MGIILISKTLLLTKEQLLKILSFMMDLSVDEFLCLTLQFTLIMN